MGIKGWTAVRFENTEVITSGSTATAMGNYFFTNSAGETKVEYTFGYFLDAAGNLRINAHHSALPYFVAKNTQAPATVISEDSGFAIKGWTAVRFENEGVILYESTATAMGNYFFTNSAGETKVEYSFGYFLDAAGNLRINLHSSHLP